MLKETITYTDFNDVTRTEELYFNLTKTDMTDMIDLEPRLAAWAKDASGDPRELTTAEITELLAIIKLLTSKAYGIKTEDGRHFRKSPEIWDDFKDSAIYDAFMFSLFEDPTKAINFLQGIMPKGLLEQAAKDVSDYQGEPQVVSTTPAALAAVVESTQSGSGETYSATETEIPAWMREGRNPTPAEFSKMSDEEKMAAFRAKSTDPK